MCGLLHSLSAAGFSSFSWFMQGLWSVRLCINKEPFIIVNSELVWEYFTAFTYICCPHESWLHAYWDQSKRSTVPRVVAQNVSQTILPDLISLTKQFFCKTLTHQSYSVATWHFLRFAHAPHHHFPFRVATCVVFSLCFQLTSYGFHDILATRITLSLYGII